MGSCPSVEQPNVRLARRLVFDVYQDSQRGGDPQLNAGADYIYFSRQKTVITRNAVNRLCITCRAWIRTFSRRLAPTAFTIKYRWGAHWGAANGRRDHREPKQSRAYPCALHAQGRTIWCPVRSGVAWRKRCRHHDPRDRALESKQQM